MPALALVIIGWILLVKVGLGTDDWVAEDGFNSSISKVGLMWEEEATGDEREDVLKVLRLGEKVGW